MVRNWSSVTPVTQLPASQIFNSLCLTPKKNKVCLRMYRYVAVFYTVLKYFEDGFTRHPTSQWFLFFLSHMFLLALPCPIIKAK